MHLLVAPVVIFLVFTPPLLIGGESIKRNIEYIRHKKRKKMYLKIMISQFCFRQEFVVNLSNQN